MVESISSTGESLSNKLLEVLAEVGLSPEQMVGQGYDGGSNMRGDIQGVQARIKEKYPRALYTWCWSHSLQLVISHAAEDSAPAVDCFSKIKDVYACVSSSSQRTSIMERHLLKVDLPVDEEVEEEAEIRRSEQTTLDDMSVTTESQDASDIIDDAVKKEHRYRRLLSISGTRFIARTRNLRIFHQKLTQVREALIEMGLEAVAYSLDARFHATVSALYTIMCPISDLSQALQSPDLNLIGAQQHLHLLLAHLKVLRTESEYKKLIAAASRSVENLDVLAEEGRCIINS